MTAFLGLPFSEMLALLSIITILCGAVWTVMHLILTSRFVNKKAYYAQRREDSELLEKHHMELLDGQNIKLAEQKGYLDSAQIERQAIRKDLEELKQSHRSALDGPLGQLVTTIKKIEENIEKAHNRAQLKDEEFLKVLNGLSTRVSILEDRGGRK